MSQLILRNPTIFTSKDGDNWTEVATVDKAVLDMQVTLTPEVKDFVDQMLREVGELADQKCIDIHRLATSTGLRYAPAKSTWEAAKRNALAQLAAIHAGGPAEP